jgi:hypothetical protein
VPKSFTTPPAKLRDGDSNPPWLEEALFGPKYANWQKKKQKGGGGDGKGRKRRRATKEDQDDDEEDVDNVVGDGMDWEMWEERKRRKRNG